MTASVHPRIDVLISTYNGVPYVARQVETLDRQTYPNVFLRFRDDGSQDRTVEAICDFPFSRPWILTKGENMGVASSFFTLLQQSDARAGYVAFCDQDDIWMDDKLERAIETLQRETAPDVPALYCSRTLLANAEGVPIAISAIPRHGPHFGNALVENIATGCTMVMNAAARNVILQHIPQHAIMHDWWCYQVIAALGQVVYDPHPRILYRQHSGNVIGAPTSPLTHFLRKVTTKLTEGAENRSRKNRHYEDLYQFLAPRLQGPARETLEAFMHRRDALQTRLRFALSNTVFRQSPLDQACLKVLLATDWF